MRRLCHPLRPRLLPHGPISPSTVVRVEARSWDGHVIRGGGDQHLSLRGRGGKRLSARRKGRLRRCHQPQCALRWACACRVRGARRDGRCCDCSHLWSLAIEQRCLAVAVLLGLERCADQQPTPAPALPLALFRPVAPLCLLVCVTECAAVFESVQGRCRLAASPDRCRGAHANARGRLQLPGCG